MTPRVITSITAKRNVPLAGRSFGHWWLELGEDESYGWWPSRLPLRFRDARRGVPGVLNGVGVTEDGTPTRDPNHGLPADYEFHPVLLVPKREDDLRNDIRTVAQTFAGEWRWSTRPTMNCRLFQLALFDAVGLVDGTGNYFTRGSGCPALTPVRRFAGRVTGARHWPRNLPSPNDRVLVGAAAVALPLVSGSLNERDATSPTSPAKSSRPAPSTCTQRPPSASASRQLAAGSGPPSPTTS